MCYLNFTNKLSNSNKKLLQLPRRIIYSTQELLNTCHFAATKLLEYSHIMAQFLIDFALKVFVGALDFSDKVIYEYIPKILNHLTDVATNGCQYIFSAVKNNFTYP